MRSVEAGGAGSEDCLKVNIYAPAEATRKSKRAFILTVHEENPFDAILPSSCFGILSWWRFALLHLPSILPQTILTGYIYGNPRNWPYEHWIEQSPNVIIVSVYYRLSSFGFLAVPELQDGANGDLNAGFLDQVESLRWVKRNIGAFGGDASRVTINGESAGGSSVELHLVARGNEGLFSGAIAQSVYRTPVPSPSQQKVVFCIPSSGAELIICISHFSNSMPLEPAVQTETSAQD